MAKTVLVLTAACLVYTRAAGPASAETYKVSDIETLAALVEGKAQPGDVIEVQPGTYMLDRPRLLVTSSGTPEAPIVIRGVVRDGQRPVIDATKTHVRNGIFFFQRGAQHVILENLELCSAQGDGRGFGQVFSRNAAGVFLEAANITVRHCYIHHNENGLFATHDADFVIIENCDIGHNGRTEHVRGDGTPLNPHRTHNFYFSSRHQIVRNCYIHDSLDGENFKSRGTNVIFAYNWVDEEVAYSVGVDSGNQQNTLWLANVVVKRTYPGMNQGRLLGIGDGTGVARGTTVALNNTFVTWFPRDLYIFTEQSSTGDVDFINNVFAGPGTHFMRVNGKGKLTGKNNWVAMAAGEIPEGFENTTRRDEPGFVSRTGMDFHLTPSSPLIDAGVSAEEYSAAVRVVTQYSRQGEGATPGPLWLKALEEIEKPYPAFEPIRKAHGYTPRKAAGAIDLGAYEFAGTAP